MKAKYLIFIFLLTMNISAFGKDSANTYRIFDAEGNLSELEKIIKEIEKVDVVFLGENHDDSVAHALQFEIFKSVFEKYGGERKVVLSLEMFDRDVQTIVNEYLQDKITEKHFLESSRAWGNYKTDYRPLVEFAKQNKLKVIAANAPRRYVNMVSRLGRDSLNELSSEAKKWLAPLPFAPPSEAYKKKFNTLMGGHGGENLLNAQTLWDATMGYSIAENLEKDKKKLIVHLNGSFHTEKRLGTVEHLLKYQPEAKALVVTMRYEENFKDFDKTKHLNLGDFIILTDAKQPRSKR